MKEFVKLRQINFVSYGHKIYLRNYCLKFT